MKFDFDKTLSSQVSNEMKSLLTPLSVAKVKHFGYVKIFPDNTHLVLTTNVEWLECFYNNFYQHGAYHKDFNSYHSGFQLWSQISDPVTVNIMRNDFDMAHGIALFKKQSDCCEIFSYGTTADNAAINEWYLNNLDILEVYSVYFKEKAATLIRKAEEDRLRFPHVLTSDFAVTSYYMESTIRDEILRNMPIKKLPVDEYLSLTQQELKCVQYAMEGSTIKCTANLLDVSPRTVETYLNLAKEKVSAKNIPHLIAILLKKYSHLIK